MIAAITLLLLFQLLGEVIAKTLALPIPGPVIGMALLFAALAARGGPTANLRQTAQGLLPVSYTHLDVYKRQVLRNGSCNSCPLLVILGTPSLVMFIVKIASAIDNSPLPHAEEWSG